MQYLITWFEIGRNCKLSVSDCKIVYPNQLRVMLDDDVIGELHHVSNTYDWVSVESKTFYAKKTSYVVEVSNFLRVS